MSFKIKIAGFFMRLSAFIGVIAINCAGGVLGAVIFWNIFARLIGERSFEPNQWLGPFTVLAFTACFFVTAHLVGGSRFGDVFYNIDRWVDSHKPHIVKWQHNGIIGVALLADFESAKWMFWEAVKSGRLADPRGALVFYDVPNVMTFSSRDYHHGKVTGTDNDLAELERGCIIDWRNFIVPGTSAATRNIPVISLQEAHRLVHGQ